MRAKVPSVITLPSAARILKVDVAAIKQLRAEGRLRNLRLFKGPEVVMKDQVVKLKQHPRVVARAAKQRCVTATRSQN